MKIEYGVQMPIEMGKSPVRLALEEFINSDEVTMCMTFDTYKEALTARNTAHVYLKRHQLLSKIRASMSNRSVYIGRREG